MPEHYIRAKEVLHRLQEELEKSKKENERLRERMRILGQQLDAMRVTLEDNEAYFKDKLK